MYSKFTEKRKEERKDKKDGTTSSSQPSVLVLWASKKK